MGLLIECSIRAALIAAAVAAVAGGLRIASPAARHIAWCSVLGAMLLLPAFTVWGPKATVRVLPVAIEAPPVAPWIPQISEEAAAEPVAVNVRMPMVEKPAWGLFQWTELLFWAYVCGVGFLMIRLLLGTVRAASLRKRAMREQGFLSSSECACPVTVGWLRPAVILPSTWCEWPQAELDAVLAHEREHARRRDPLVQWLAAFNRCVFWFHPLAWWLERRLAMLAEDACDSAVVALGHDPRDYSEYLLHQARAIGLAGGRLPLAGSTMGEGSLSKRISRLLEARPVVELSRRRAAVATALCVFVITAFTACQLGRVEKAAPGQPTMNELEHRHAAVSMQYEAQRKAVVQRARALTPEEAASLLAKVKENPEDRNTYLTLLRYYELKGIVKERGALWLWYIEHRPGGRILPGNINPQYDREGYLRGKAIWLAHLKRPGASAEIYQRAANFLEGGDKPLAESVLMAGRKAFPNDPRWARAFSMHYSRVLVNAQEAQSPYAQKVRAQLAKSSDAGVLTQTAESLLFNNNPYRRGGNGSGSDVVQLARTLVDRAASIEPDSNSVKRAKFLLARFEENNRAMQLARMSPAELATVPRSDRMLHSLTVLRWTWIQWIDGKFVVRLDDAEAKARELLKLAAQNRNDALYGDAVYEANINLGKIALRRGDKKAAVRYMLAAADTPGSEVIRIGPTEMNLQRSLVDWGERSAVAQFLERMAPKTARSKQFLDWAAEIRKGINPDGMPGSSYPGCTQGPC
jgi:tetratricopeptide (TPR) repeat protein